MQVSDIQKDLAPVRMHEKSDKFDYAFCSVALQAGKYLLHDTESVGLLTWFDDTYSHLMRNAPFGSHMKFTHMFRRTTDKGDLAWIFRDSKHCLTAGALLVEDFSIDRLKEVGFAASLMRKECLELLLGKELADLNFPEQTHSKISKWLQNHDAHASCFLAEEQSHMREIKESSGHKYIDVICNLCYPRTTQVSRSMTAALKAGVRNRKQCPEILDYSGIKELLDDVRDARKVEIKEANVTLPIPKVGAKPVSEDDCDADSWEDELCKLKQDEYAKVSERLKKLPKEKQQAMDQAVTKIYQESCRIFVLGDSPDFKEIRRQLAESPLAAKHGCGAAATPLGCKTGLKFTLIIDDLRFMGVPNIQQMTRVAPFRELVHHQVVTTLLEARDAGWDVESGHPAVLNTTDVAMVFDLNRPALVHTMLAPFRPDVVQKKKSKEDVAAATDFQPPKTELFQLSVLKDEDSIRDRKQLVRGGISQMEQIHCVTLGKPLPDVMPSMIKGKHYVGSNQGDGIAVVELPSLVDDFKLTLAEKKEFFGGGKWVREVGGRNPGADQLLDAGPGCGDQELDAILHASAADDDDACLTDSSKKRRYKKRTQAKKLVEVVFKESWPWQFAEELQIRYDCGHVWDIWIGVGANIIAAISRGVTACGFAMTPAQAQHVEQRVRAAIAQMILDAKCVAHYSPKLAKLMSDDDGGEGVGPSKIANGAFDKAKDKVRALGKAKPKTSKAKAKAEEKNGNDADVEVAVAEGGPPKKKAKKNQVKIPAGDAGNSAAEESDADAFLESDWEGDDSDKTL